MANTPNRPNRLGIKPLGGVPTIQPTIQQQYFRLAQAAIHVLVLHGLPTNCEAMQQEWQFAGTPEQQAALTKLHRVIIDNLNATEYSAAQKGKLS